MSDQVPGTALRLLQLVLEVAPGGRVFTSQDAVVAAAELGLTAGHTYKLLSQLVGRGLLGRPRRRLYVMNPPFGGTLPVRPLVVAVHAAAPAAVSGDTALAHWGLLSQAPVREEVVSTSARIQWDGGLESDGTDRLWSVDGATIRLHRIPAREMFGTTSVRLDAESVVPMFDRERALVELVRSGADGPEWFAELVRDHGRDIDSGRLRRYAERLHLDSPLGTGPARTKRRGRAVVSA